MSNETYILDPVITVWVEDPVLNEKSFHLNSKQGGYMVWVSTEKYFKVIWLSGKGKNSCEGSCLTIKP